MLVGAVSFGGAWAWTTFRSPEGRRLLATLPGNDALVDWAPDAVVREHDLRELRAEAARLPAVARPADATGGRAPDIVVIVLDTLRADRMGVYGYPEGTTPRLDAWAGASRVFDHMVSDGAWTLPSHASLFTGKPIIAHGARGTRLGEGLASPLARGSPTVAGALRDAGYRTAGIAANRAFLAPLWGLSQGFDLWMCQQLRLDAAGLPYTSGDRVTELARALLARPRSEPLFLFLNYMDAHAPWVPRRGYVKDPAAIRPEHLPYGEGWGRDAERLMADHQADPAALATWSEAYDGDVRFLDEQVGALLEALPGLGVGEDDYVFVLSDHGEYLGEHDLVEHSKDLYEEVLRVPLIVRGPGYPRGRDLAPVQTHDVASMILAAAGQPPLAGSVRTDALQVSELYYSRHRDLAHPRYGHRFDRVRRAFRLGDHKLLVGGTAEAYDLDGHRPEVDDVYTTAPWVAELEAMGKAWVEAQVAAPNAPIVGVVDEEALRVLGYVE